MLSVPLDFDGDTDGRGALCNSAPRTSYVFSRNLAVTPGWFVKYTVPLTVGLIPKPDRSHPMEPELIGAPLESPPAPPKSSPTAAIFAGSDAFVDEPMYLLVLATSVHAPDFCSTCVFTSTR